MNEADMLALPDKSGGASFWTKNLHARRRGKIVCPIRAICGLIN
jgi:hypothetical protein